VEKMTQPLKDAFAKLYAENLNEAELREAIAFFESKEGQAVVSLRLMHEENLYEMAAKGEAIDSEMPAYPPQVKKSLEKFLATSAGQSLVGEGELVAHEPFASQISSMRDAAFAACLQELAAKTEKP
jgi:hypothetical protein